jgi:hypothetical protein
VQKVPNRDTDNGIYDQYKGDLFDEKFKGGLRGSPFINSYISADIKS